MQRKLGQLTGTQAIKLNLSCLMSPELFVPVVSIKNINDIDWEALAKCGVSYIVFDKDNTLTSPYELEIHPLIREAF